jgi:hypothetical protein
MKSTLSLINYLGMLNEYSAQHGAQGGRLRRRLAWACAPGMARYFIGASPMVRFSQSRRQGEGQGRRREAGSEGSPIQNCGAMNKNRI